MILSINKNLLSRSELTPDPVPGAIAIYEFKCLDDANNTPTRIDGISKRDLFALDFNGVDQYLDKASDASLLHDEQDAFSVTWWFKPVLNSTTGTIRQFIAYGQSGTGLDGFALSMPSDSARVRFISEGGGFNTNTDVVWDNWNFCAFTYDGTTARTYLNEDAVTESVRAVNTFSAEILNIGCNTTAGSSFWWGDLDGIRIYDRVLTATEIGLIRDYIDQRLRVNGELLTLEGEYVEFEQRAWV